MWYGLMSHFLSFFLSQLLVREHAALGGTYSQLAEDREALFAAYTALDCKLSEVEAEIME